MAKTTTISSRTLAIVRAEDSLIFENRILGKMPPLTTRIRRLSEIGSGQFTSGCPITASISSRRRNSLEALDCYARGIELLADDPDNREWQRGLPLSQQKMGGTQAAGGSPRDSLGQQERMLVNGRAGELYAQLGQLGQAVAAYRRELAAAEELAAARSEDPDRQRAVSVCYSTVGDVQRMGNPRRRWRCSATI
jgi:tetratricopeptide (TPR) repeat protein